MPRPRSVVRPFGMWIITRRIRPGHRKFGYHHRASALLGFDLQRSAGQRDPLAHSDEPEPALLERVRRKPDAVVFDDRDRDTIVALHHDTHVPGARVA